LSWARDALSALRKIILIEDRVAQLTDQVKTLADSYADIDRRLLKLEAKFELIERMAGSRRPSKVSADDLEPPKLESSRIARRKTKRMPAR
jgi:hypothetical protein